MNTSRQSRRLGLAVLTGGLAFVGTANAVELIVDGSFENTRDSSNPVVKVGGTPQPGVGGGWSLFSTYAYSTLYTLPGPVNSGLQFLRPYPSGTYGITQSSQSVTQLVSLTASAALTADAIDLGLGQFTVSAWFSSYLTQGDYSTLTVDFLDGNGVFLGQYVLGGSSFVASIPTGGNAKYPDAKQWAQDVRTDLIPLDARTARVIITATAANGAPDGYVDLVSLNVSDITETTPSVTSADPPNDAVHVGPVVNLAVTLTDRVTFVDTNTLQLLLDDIVVTPSIEKVDLTTTVRYAAGLLPALSSHRYAIHFSDDGAPVRRQTNQFRFTVADYVTLPTSERTPLGSEDATRPGFNVRVYQVEPLTDPQAAQQNLTESIELAESVLAGFLGTNVANLAGAEADNRFAVPGVINWATTSGAAANFTGDSPFPGIPGTSGSENSFVDEILTYVRFPLAGYYQMGVNNEDQFRLTLGTSGTQTLEIHGPTNMVLPCVAIATNITQLQFGGSLPIPPLTAPIVYATPSGLPDDGCFLADGPSLAGKIALIDRGGMMCSSADKADQAERAGAVAVILITPGDTGFPIRLDDINPNVHIPVAVIAENYGGSQLKGYLNNSIAVTATFGGDPNVRIAEWDGPKGFGAVDVTVGFAVAEAGVYPMRLVAGQRTGGANLEWFAIQPDGARILINDTSNLDAILAFRARTPGPPRLGVPTVSAGKAAISWTGGGTLEEALSITGPWHDSPDQSNPQQVPTGGVSKLYRIRR